MAAATATAAPGLHLEQPLPASGMFWQVVKPFVLGGSAGVMATCCIQPIDLVKVRLQLAEQKAGVVRPGPLTLASSILRNEGLLTFYSGISAAVLRQLTSTATRFGVFTTLEQKFKDEKGKMPWDKRVASSLLAGGLGALIGTPADAALVRMQADTMLPVGSAQRRGYRHVGDALFRMAREEGFRGFFVGASPAIYRGLAVNMGNLGTYGVYKQWWQETLELPEGSPVSHLLGGACSGITGASISLPFDFVKTRLQRQVRGPDGELPYKGFIDCLTKSVRNEGPLVLYRGYVPFVMRIVPHVCLTWTFLEALRTIFV